MRTLSVICRVWFLHSRKCAVTTGRTADHHGEGDRDPDHRPHCCELEAARGCLLGQAQAGRAHKQLRGTACEEEGVR